MKVLCLMLSIMYFLLAVSYPLANVLPSMFATIVMCLALGLMFLGEYFRLKNKEVKNKTH